MLLKFFPRDFAISNIKDEINTRLTEILQNRECEGERKETKSRTAANLPDFHLRCDDRVTYCTLLFHYWMHRCPSQRDCFALISRLNIQSLRHARLARAILSQPSKSKWYLCPRVLRVAMIFPPPSRSMLPHWVMEHIPRRDASRMIPGGNAEPSAFFEA